MTDWNATVEYIGAISDDEAEALVQAAGGFVVAAIHRGDRDRTSVSFGIQGSTLRLAAEAAEREARRITADRIAGDPVAMRVVTADELALEVERPAIPELVDTTAAREILYGITQQRLSQLVDEHPDFPEPIQRFAGGRMIFTRSSIDAFKQRWNRQPGRPRKNVPALAEVEARTEAASTDPSSLVTRGRPKRKE